MQRRYQLLPILFVLMGAIETAHGLTTAPGFHEIPPEPIRHVIPWGNPSTSGQIKVLAIMPHAALGDIAQLRDHLEMELEIVALWDRKYIGFDPQFPHPETPDASREAVLERLEKALRRKKIDLIILGQSDPAVLPEAIQDQIKDRVESGTGLLLANHGMDPAGNLAQWLGTLAEPDPMPDLLTGVGTLGISRDFESALVSYHVAGEGRVATLTFFHEHTPNHALIPLPDSPYYMRPEFADNAFSLVAKTAQWASQHAEPIRITHIVDLSPRGPDDEEIPPGYPQEFIDSVRRNAFTQPLRPYAVHLAEPAPHDMDVWYRMRHVGVTLPDILRTTEIPFKKGADYYPLDIVAAPGNYLIDIWLKDRGGIVAWFTADITVPGWPTLSNPRLLRDDKPVVWVQPNDYLNVHAEVLPGALSTKREQGTVFARVVDSFGRQIAHASEVVGSQGGPVSLRLELADIVAPLVQVEIFAVPSTMTDESTLVNQAARDVFYLPVRMPVPPLQPRVILTTEGRLDHGAYHQIESLRDHLGAAVLHAPLTVDSLLAAGRSGLQRLTQMTPEDSVALSDGLIRSPCLSTPAYQDQIRGAVEATILQAYAGGPPIYSLGTGVALTDTDANLCQSPTCLNRFHTYLEKHYQRPALLNQAWGSTYTQWGDVTPYSVERCREERHYLPWVDFRMSMNHVQSESLRRAKDEARRLDPQAQIGFQPLPRKSSPQSGIQWDQVCATMDYVVVPNDADALRRLQSFHGMHPWNGIVVQNSQFNTTELESRSFAWRCALDRIPALWLDAPFANTSTGLLGPTGLPRPTFAAFCETRMSLDQGLGALLLKATPYVNGIAFLDTPENAILVGGDPEDAGDQLSDESWFADTLNDLGFAPTVHSLLPALNHSLENVNTLILPDTRVLTPEQREALSKFHMNDGLIIASRDPVRIEARHDDPVPRALPFLHPLIGASGKAPLWCNRPVWVRQLEENTPEAQIKALLETAGNTPMPEVKTPSGQRHRQQRYYYAFGSATLLAWLPESSATRPLKRASIQIPEDHYAYDLGATEILPHTGRFQWSPTPGTSMLLSVLPYRVKKLSLSLPELVNVGERLTVELSLDTDDVVPGIHLISLLITGPDGEEMPHYRQLLETQEGHVETYIPLAQNEMKGRYTLTATDLLTGTHEQSYLVLQ